MTDRHFGNKRFCIDRNAELIQRRLRPFAHRFTVKRRKPRPEQVGDNAFLLQLAVKHDVFT